jgi:hypothetical protein
MHTAAIISVIVLCTLITAGCIQLPGMHILTNTPDPVIGQWIGGELPATDRHIIFYENQTFFSTDFFLNRGETTDSGNWTKNDTNLYVTQSVTGEITYWVYDSFDDSVYMSRIPQMKYHRYKG